MGRTRNCTKHGSGTFRFESFDSRGREGGTGFLKVFEPGIEGDERRFGNSRSVFEDSLSGLHEWASGAKSCQHFWVRCKKQEREKRERERERAYGKDLTTDTVSCDHTNTKGLARFSECLHSHLCSLSARTRKVGVSRLSQRTGFTDQASERE